MKPNILLIYRKIMLTVMRKSLLMALAIFFACTAHLSAAPVTKADALTGAKAFMKAKGVAFEGKLQNVGGPKRIGANNVESPYFYVFNNDNGEGFVIMSADDRTNPVLGYSDKGAFDVQLMDENVGALLEGYKREIDMLDDINYQTQYVAPNTSTTPTTHPVRPLLETQWGQNTPFNQNAPKRSGVSCLLGCTGVAMAQLVYYYRDKMNAKLAYAIPGYTKSGLKVSAIPAGTALNWNNMYSVYDKTQTSAQLTNTSKFITYCAIALESDFKAGENAVTIASPEKFLSSTIKYFNFKSSSTGFSSRKGYSYERWKRMIIDELYQGRPVPYVAYQSATDGHIFLVDGYDGGDFFHVNWGWAGYCDGFFSLSVLNSKMPDSFDAYTVADSYILNQTALFDLQPAINYSNSTDNSFLKATISTASGNAATIQFANYTTVSGNYYLGLGCFDANGNIQLVKQYGSSPVTIASGSYSIAKFTLAAADFSAANLAKGTYKLYPVCKLKGTDEWKQCDQVADYNYIKTVYSSSISLSIAASNAVLTATGMSFIGSKTKSQSQPVVVSVKNTGEDFYGYISLYANTSSALGSKRSSTLAYIPAGKTVNVQLSFIPGTTGTYNVWAVSGSTIGSSKVTIYSASASRDIRVINASDIVLENVKSGKTVVGTTLKGVAKLYNNSSSTFDGDINIYLFVLKSSWTNTWEVTTSHVNIASKKYGEAPFLFENLNPASTYALVIRYGDNTNIAYNYIVTYFYVTNAVMTYNSLGESKPLSVASTITLGADVAVADFTGLTSSITKIVPSSNPNALYLIGANDKVVSGLSGKNIVKSNVADKITLTDGYPFYTLNDITAKEISYTRTAKIGTSGRNGWQTIVLPFAPTTITCGGKQLDWFKADDDENKNFWLKEFSAIQGYNTVCFGYAQQFEANKPYIMAVPGSAWGEVYNLVGKPITFSASNVTLYHRPFAMIGSDVFNFRGSYSKQKMSDVFCLDSDGTKFIAGTFTVNPFSCYFVTTDGDMKEDFNELNIGSFDADADGIVMPFADKGEEVCVYHLNGMKAGVAKIKGSKIMVDHLPKGIYVVNGKKLIK